MRDVILVAGAPCSGKSWHVQQHAAAGDLVVDWDDLAVEAGSPQPHDHAKPYRDAASKRRMELERDVAAMGDGTAWVIRTLPRVDERADVMRRLRATDLVVLDPGVQECLDRAKLTGRHPDVDAVILKWYGLQWGARCYDRPPAEPKPRDPRHSRQWRRVRAIVLQGQPPCSICGRAMRYDIDWDQRHPDPLYPTADHIVPIALGGAPYDLANLRPVCWEHNTERQARPIATPRGAAMQHTTTEDW